MSAAGSSATPVAPKVIVFYPGSVGEKNNITFNFKPTLEKLRQDVVASCAKLVVHTKLTEPPCFDNTVRHSFLCLVSHNASVSHSASVSPNASARFHAKHQLHECCVSCTSAHPRAQTIEIKTTTFQAIDEDDYNEQWDENECRKFYLCHKGDATAVAGEVPSRQPATFAAQTIRSKRRSSTRRPRSG
jgi:hypothetical protein